MNIVGFSKIEQVGIVVRDIDRATRQYESLGFGPFKRYDIGKYVAEHILYGKTIRDVKNEVSIGQGRSADIELIQPVSGKSILREFLDAKGEGIHHIAVSVDDLDKETERLHALGFEEVYTIKMLSGSRATFFDGKNTGTGLPYIEVVQHMHK